MKLLELISHIEKMKTPIIRAKDISLRLSIENSYANYLLGKLDKSGHLIKIKRGLWAVPEKVSFLSLPEHLTAPFSSYISLQTALYYHDMIDQIPSVTYAVTTGKTKRYLTPLGDFSIHHLQPSFFFGFKAVGSYNIKMATPEKALIDFLYLSTTRSKLFHSLPEFSLPAKFDIQKAEKIIEMITSSIRCNLVKKKLRDLLKKN